MYTSKKNITRTTTIVENIPEGESDFEYRVAKDTTFTLIVSAYHVKSAQTSVKVRLVGKGARAIIIGIVMGDQTSKVILHTLQQHEAPDTTSDLLVKTVLKDQATSIYDGGIRVEKAAQRTNAYQRNENLLLSEKTYAESKPSLEILANDVRCTHGATVGPIDAEQLWYLSTRGIGKSEGVELIADGFVNSALLRIEDENVRGTLQKRFVHAV